MLHLHLRNIIYLFILELHDGVFLLTNASLATKKRFISGVLTQYRTVALNDIVCFHQNDTMLLLVVPLVCMTHNLSIIYYIFVLSWILNYNMK